jgi:hypothetical protein
MSEGSMVNDEEIKKELAGTFADFLDPVKKKAIVARILELKSQGKTAVMNVFRLVRKGKLMLTADVKNDSEVEDNFDFDIHMETDMTTLNVHLAKPDSDYIYENEVTGEDASDYPITVLKEDAESFLYILG